MVALAVWACLQPSRVLPVEEMTVRAEIVGLAEVQGPGGGRGEHRLRFSEVWKGRPFSSFVLLAPEAGLRSGETVVVFASAASAGRHAPLEVFRVASTPDRGARRVSDRLAPSLPLPALKEKVFRILGRPLPTDDPPPRKTAPPPPAAPAPPPPAPEADVDRLLPWGFVLAALLIGTGLVWLRRQDARP